MTIREAPFALRIVRRSGGRAAIVYRRSLDTKQDERLRRLGAISETAFAAATPLLRAAVRACNGRTADLADGPFHPLDADWGARVACYAMASAGLRNPARLRLAAANQQHADATEAAWWLGLMMNGHGNRAVRALRVVVEAVP
jgi:hypothetical protein